MWSLAISTLAGPVLKFIGTLLLNWISKHEAASGQTAQANATAKAAAIIAAKVPPSAAADALDQGGI